MKATKKQIKHLGWLFDNDYRAVLIGLNMAQEALDFNPTLTYSELTKEIEKRKKVYSDLYKETKANFKPTKKQLLSGTISNSSVTTLQNKKKRDK